MDLDLTLAVIGDLSYAWGDTMDSAFTDLMRNGVRKDPKLVGRLRATFLKVSLIMCIRDIKLGYSTPYIIMLLLLAVVCPGRSSIPHRPVRRPLRPRLRLPLLLLPDGGLCYQGPPGHPGDRLRFAGENRPAEDAGHRRRDGAAAAQDGEGEDEGAGPAGQEDGGNDAHVKVTHAKFST